MKMRYNLLLLALLSPVIVWSQSSLDSVLTAVRSSNKAMAASRHQMEAETRSARTGIFPPNPEAEFNYLWGDPSSSGTRTDFSITQSFSFPSVYVQQANISELLQDKFSLQYQQTEREVLLHATFKWINIVALNKQLGLLQNRLRLSEEIAVKAKTQLAAGDIDVIKYHHAQMEMVNFKMEVTDQEVQRALLQEELKQLCGGKEIIVNDTAFPSAVPVTKEQVIRSLSAIPLIRSLEKEVLVSEKGKALALSKWLPDLKAGYYSEVVPGLTYRGIKTGISIPLWESSNTMKSANLRIKAAEAALENVRSEQLAEINSLIRKRDILASRLMEIRSALLPVEDLSLLKKALDAGQISISEFYYETSVFYIAWKGFLQTEKELAEVEAELRFYLPV